MPSKVTYANPNDSKKDQFQMSLCLLKENSERKFKNISVIAKNLLQSLKRNKIFSTNKKRWLQQGQA
jgi:hypothetical protein